MRDHPQPTLTDLPVRVLLGTLGRQVPDAAGVVRDLESRLCDRFAIGHTTIQVESCHPCGEIHHGAGEHNHPHRIFTS